MTRKTYARAIALLVGMLMLAWIIVAIMVSPAHGATIGRTPATAPFTWQQHVWCPSYQERYGCGATEHPHQYTVSFSPSQVTRDGQGDMRLTMDTERAVSGAMNSEDHGMYGENVSFSTMMFIPCDASGMVENWPAFWLFGSQGGWPAEGEPDIVEGLHGVLKWHYHYLAADGKLGSVGGVITNDGCGWHSFGLYRGRSHLGYWFDGHRIAVVTPAEIGVPLATDPMYVLYANAGGQSGGTPADTSLIVRSFREW